MKIDWEQKLERLGGGEMIETYLNANDQEATRPLTLGRACIGVLLDPNAAQGMKGAEKYDCYKLARRIDERGVEVTTEEVALIKRMAGQVLGTWVVGQIWSRLEGETP